MTNTKKLLDEASEAYYNGVGENARNPVLTDAQFDALSEKTGYNALGATATGTTKKHFHRMYSLDKFYEDTGKQPPLDAKENVLSYSPKLDGAAISALYVEGSLVQVLTRGDGIEGKDITSNFLASSVLPLTINDTRTIQVTGEIVADKTIKNSRNYAAGSLNLKEPSDFKTRAISFFAYDSYPYFTDTYDGDMSILNDLGFCTVKDAHISEIYDTDGIVYRVNDRDVCASMGYTSKHPKYAYALKVREECIETEILSVEWNTGRTGVVTPVAHLVPVAIGDKTVTKATLNNPGFIQALDIRIGSIVGVRLAGKIIPEIVYKAQA